MAVRAYQVLPLSFTGPVGHVLPMLEVVVGACVAAGAAHPAGAVVSALLQVAFIAGIVSVWVRGIDRLRLLRRRRSRPDTRSTGTPGRSPATSGCCCSPLWLVVRPRTPYAVDNLLFPARSTTPEQDHARVVA